MTSVITAGGDRSARFGRFCRFFSIPLVAFSLLLAGQVHGMGRVAVLCGAVLVALSLQEALRRTPAQTPRSRVR